MPVIDLIKESTVSGDMNKVVDLINQAVNEGFPPADIIQNGLIKAMTIVGESFKKNEIYVPEMLVAALAMKAALGILKPMMVGTEIKPLATAVLGTVKGDMHDIGKNLVGIMMEGAGVEVVDLGVDNPPEKFVEAVTVHKPQFLGLSALLTTTLPNMKATIDALEKAGLSSRLKVLVGGAPVNQKFADEIGADGYGENAAEVVDLIKSMIS